MLVGLACLLSSVSTAQTVTGPVSVTVVGIDGEPATGCRVDVFAEPGGSSRLRFSHDFALPTVKPLHRGVSDLKGVARFAPVPSGRYFVVAQRPGEAGTATLRCTMTRSPRPAQCLIGLRRVRTVDVTVLTESGHALPHALVSLYDPESSHRPTTDSPSALPSGVADDLGQIRFLINKDSTRLGGMGRCKRVRALGHRCGVKPVGVTQRIAAEGGSLVLIMPPTVTLRFKLPSSRTGSVAWNSGERFRPHRFRSPSWALGATLAGCAEYGWEPWEIEVPPAGRDIAAFMPNSSVSIARSRRSSAEHAETFQLGPETYQAVVLSSFASSFSTGLEDPIPPPTRLSKVQLEYRARRKKSETAPRIQGRVRCVVPEIRDELRVSIRTTTSRYPVTRRPDPDGRFEFRDLEEGTYRLTVHLFGIREIVVYNLHDLTVQTGQTLIPPELEDLHVGHDFYLQEIRVFDPEGNPARGCSVAPLNGVERFPSWSRSSHTDFDGYARVVVRRGETKNARIDPPLKPRGTSRRLLDQLVPIDSRGPTAPIEVQLREKRL